MSMHMYHIYIISNTYIIYMYVFKITLCIFLCLPSHLIMPTHQQICWCTENNSLGWFMVWLGKHHRHWQGEMLKPGSVHVTILLNILQVLLNDVKIMLYCLLQWRETIFSVQVHPTYHILYQPNSLLLMLNPMLPIVIHTLLLSNYLLFIPSVHTILIAITLFRIKM